MKQPKLTDLKIDKIGTKIFRQKISKNKDIKIIINFDSNMLHKSTKISEGISKNYFLANLIANIIDKQKNEDEKLKCLENEIESLKKKLAA